MINNAGDYGIAVQHTGQASSLPIRQTIENEPIPSSIPRVWGLVGGVLLLFGQGTTPVVYRDAKRDFQISGISSIGSIRRQRRGRPLSAAEIWSQVGQVHADALQRRLHRRKIAMQDLVASMSDEP
ncbi:MAG TPA: hypothetical protein VMV69_00200 [Pirellulales bacterium]|nr:hypothetical protein [Pirellulales bacterium]